MSAAVNGSPARWGACFSRAATAPHRPTTMSTAVLALQFCFSASGAMNRVATTTFSGALSEASP